MAANDSQPQPGFLTQLMQKILGGIGLSAAAAQGGPGAPTATPAQNPWVKQAPQAAPQGAPAPAGLSGGGQSTDYLKGIIDAQMAHEAAEKAKKTPAPSKRPPSSQVDTSAPIMQLFQNLVGKVAS